MSNTQDSYSRSGVDYSKLDPIKLLAQKKARSTSNQLTSFGMQELKASRGESAYVWEEPGSYRALVVEGLGTKNLIADAVRKITGKTYYDNIAQDTIAMIVNDLVVVGALPQVVNAYFAVGDSNWLSDEQRASDLINGWAEACKKSGATWGGGETPTLKGIVDPKTIDLGGSAVGIIKPKKNLVLGDKLAAGDKIVLIESSGIHANGVTLIRSLAKKNPKLYRTKMSDGRLFGEALLSPSHLYVKLVQKLQAEKLNVHYMVNITGHGWRKLMRATKSFTYEMNVTPNPQPEFLLLQKAAKLTEREMYGNYNMGAGFAVYVPAKQAEQVVLCAKKVGLKAWVAGTVKKGPKKVVIKNTDQNIDITFDSKSLGVR